MNEFSVIPGVDYRNVELKYDDVHLFSYFQFLHDSESCLVIDNSDRSKSWDDAVGFTIMGFARFRDYSYEEYAALFQNNEYMSPQLWIYTAIFRAYGGGSSYYEVPASISEKDWNFIAVVGRSFIFTLLTDDALVDNVFTLVYAVSTTTVMVYVNGTMITTSPQSSALQPSGSHYSFGCRLNTSAIVSSRGSYDVDMACWAIYSGLLNVGQIQAFGRHCGFGWCKHISALCIYFCVTYLPNFS